MDKFILFIYIAPLSLCVGSFLNVLIYRLPLSMQRQWEDEAREALSLDEISHPVFNISKPRSHCPQCKTTLTWWQNIPILSYLLLRAKCFQCKTHISLRYPLVEFATCLLSVLAAYQASSWLQLGASLILVWGLIALMLIDLDTFLLPDSITLPLLWLGLLVNTVGTYVPLVDAVWGAVVGYLSLWSIYWVFKLTTGKEGMGAGDFKLLACIGAWLGWQALPAAVLISAGLGSIIGIGLIVLKKQQSDQQIPFGPFLGLAFLVLLLAPQWVSRGLAMVNL